MITKYPDPILRQQLNIIGWRMVEMAHSANTFSANFWQKIQNNCQFLGSQETIVGLLQKYLKRLRGFWVWFLNLSPPTWTRLSPSPTRKASTPSSRWSWSFISFDIFSAAGSFALQYLDRFGAGRPGRPCRGPQGLHHHVSWDWGHSWGRQKSLYSSTLASSGQSQKRIHLL